MKIPNVGTAGRSDEDSLQILVLLWLSDHAVADNHAVFSVIILLKL